MIMVMMMMVMMVMMVMMMMRMMPGDTHPTPVRLAFLLNMDITISVASEDHYDIWNKW